MCLETDQYNSQSQRQLREKGAEAKKYYHHHHHQHFLHQHWEIIVPISLIKMYCLIPIRMFTFELDKQHQQQQHHQLSFTPAPQRAMNCCRKGERTKKDLWKPALVIFFIYFFSYDIFVGSPCSRPMVFHLLPLPFVPCTKYCVPRLVPIHVRWQTHSLSKQFPATHPSFQELFV